MEVIFDAEVCPHCGQEDPGIMAEIVREETALGNLGEGVIGHVMANMYSIVDARKPPLVGARIPAIRVYTDICKKCGMAFNCRIEKGRATLPLRPGDIPTFV